MGKHREDELMDEIHKRVFDVEQEKQKKLNEFKNQNPENLMQMPAGWQQEEKVGWKVWKYLF